MAKRKNKKMVYYIITVPAEKYHHMSKISSSHFAYKSSISLFRLLGKLP